MAKVLLIEDDPLMIRMYKKIFTFDGHEVETAVDGEEGFSKVSSFNPTVILLDVKYIVKSEYDPKQISDMVKEIIAAHTRDDVPKTANV